MKYSGLDRSYSFSPETATAVGEISPNGFGSVFWKGAYWPAELANPEQGIISTNTIVSIVRREGIILIVSPITPSPWENPLIKNGHHGFFISQTVLQLYSQSHIIP